MNFQDAEKAYQDLRAQYSAGKLSSTDFEAEVSKLKLQDGEGRWWQIGVQSGDWYVHDGQKWNKGEPPASGLESMLPTAPPEATMDVVTDVPAPTPRAPRSSVLPPRLFSAAPAGRGNGGLSTPVMMGIVAVVAVIGLAIIVIGFLYVSGRIGGTPTTKVATPTTVAAVVPPTPALPTLPVFVPTATSVLLPTIPVTPTLAITPTAVAVTATVPAKPAATRAPVASPTPAPPKAAATPTSAAPAGIYVTKLQLDPNQAGFNQQIGFRISVLNTTGNMVTYRWLVKIYQCSKDPCGADDFRKSIGESTVVQSNILPGTADISAPRHWSAGLGSCTYVAQPHYYDELGNVVPFRQTNGQPLYHVFRLCQ